MHCVSTGLRRERDYSSLRCRGRPCKRKDIAPQCFFLLIVILLNASVQRIPTRKKGNAFCVAFSFAEREGFEPPEV